jgi:hypothetical protein
MDSHSRLWSSQNGTLRLPQALILLLRTALAGPTNDQRTQELTDLSPWTAIKNSLHHLASLLNPFVSRSDFTTSLFVGMVKLTALCGIGSAYWFWTQRSKKGNAAPSITSQHVSEPMDGKEAPHDLHHIPFLRAPVLAHRRFEFCTDASQMMPPRPILGS